MGDDADFPPAIAECLALIGAANAVPVALKRVLSNRYSQPVDGGLVLREGRRLLGPPKTWRVVGLTLIESIPCCTRNFAIPG